MKDTPMLDTRLRLSAPDDFYEALIAAHQNLDNPASHALNARLVLLLANQVGDQDTLLAALRAARGSAGGAAVATLQRQGTELAAPSMPVRAG